MLREEKIQSYLDKIGVRETVYPYDGILCPACSAPLDLCITNESEYTKYEHVDAIYVQTKNDYGTMIILDFKNPGWYVGCCEKYAFMGKEVPINMIVYIDSLFRSFFSIYHSVDNYIGAESGRGPMAKYCRMFVSAILNKPERITVRLRELCKLSVPKLGKPEVDTIENLVKTFRLRDLDMSKDCFIVSFLLPEEFDA